MENVSVPTRWPLWNTPKEPESISLPSCFASFSLSSLGHGAAEDATDCAITNITAASMGSRRKNNFTLFLLFQNELEEPERKRRMPIYTKTAKYSRSRHQGRVLFLHRFMYVP